MVEEAKNDLVKGVMEILQINIAAVATELGGLKAKDVPMIVLHLMKSISDVKMEGSDKKRIIIEALKNYKFGDVNETAKAAGLLLDVVPDLIELFYELNKSLFKKSTWAKCCPCCCKVDTVAAKEPLPVVVPDNYSSAASGGASPSGN